MNDLIFTPRKHKHTKRSSRQQFVEINQEVTSVNYGRYSVPNRCEQPRSYLILTENDQKTPSQLTTPVSHPPITGAQDFPIPETYKHVAFKHPRKPTNQPTTTEQIVRIRVGKKCTHFVGCLNTLYKSITESSTS